MDGHNAISEEIGVVEAFQMVEQLKRQIPIGNQGEQWEQQYFYSKKDRYSIIMQLRELDETTVKYFIGNEFCF